MLFLKNLLKKEKFYIVSILILAAFLRLYRIGDYLTFLGDEGRDVLIAKSILQGDLTLLGPRASAGDFFLGPIYYYFISPFLLIFNYDPVGPAVMVGLFGVATVYLVYLIGKNFFSSTTGLIAAALFAVSPLVIAYSRSSWNPNIMPFFSIVTLLACYKGIKESSKKYILLSGFLLGISMQLHYLSVFLAVILFIYIFVTIIISKNKSRLKDLVLKYLQIIAGFIIGFSLFLLFELRHNFPNIKTIINFVFNNTFEKQYESSQSFYIIAKDVFFRLFARLIYRFPPPEQINFYNPDIIQLWAILAIVTGIASTGLLIYLVFKEFKNTKRDKLNQYLLILIWLVIGVALFGLYKKPIYDYYLGFIFPIPFLLFGLMLSKIIEFSKNKKVAYAISAIIFIAVFVFNLMGAPFFFQANRQKDQVKLISDFVLSNTDNKPFNFALITPGNSDHAYRYFFNLAGRDPVVIENPQIDPDRKSVTDQLLIVCEDVNCAPLGNSLWEVAGFGRAEIVGSWDVSVVKVYKLVPLRE